MRDRERRSKRCLPPIVRPYRSDESEQIARAFRTDAVKATIFKVVQCLRVHIECRCRRKVRHVSACLAKRHEAVEFT